MTAPPALDVPHLAPLVQKGAVGTIRTQAYIKGGWKISYARVPKAKQYKITTGHGTKIVTKNNTNVYLNDDTEGPYDPIPALTVQALNAQGYPIGVPSKGPACTDYMFLSVRGSGQNDNNRGFGEQLGDRGLRIVNELRQILQVGRSTIASYGIPYAANSLNNITGWTAYQASKLSGIIALKQSILDIKHVCPVTKFILFGYSQGADIVATTWKTLPNLIKDSTISVILFADPAHNPDDTSSHGNATSAGVLPARSPFNDPKIQSWCAVGDAICAKTTNLIINIKKHIHGTTYDTWEKDQALYLAKIINSQK